MSDSNYTLLGQSLSLGGVVSRSVDLETGEICENLTTEDGKRSDARRRQVLRDVSLSKSHNGRKTVNSSYSREGNAENSEIEKTGKNPSISWRSGASILKTSQGSSGEQIGGGVRGEVKGFSANSRRGLMYDIGSIRRDAELPCFVTLTYPSEFPSPKQSKRDLKIFCQRLKYEFPEVCGIWKLEPQDRGAPHYHFLIWGVDVEQLKKFVPYAWHDVSGNGDGYHLLFHLGLLHNSKHCVSLVNSFRGVWAYASKYLGKAFSVAGWEDLHTGRFWGHINKEKIPYGNLCEFEITSQRAFQIMRYQRRFSGRKVSNKGFTLFCIVDFWIPKLFSEVA
jgi:hypothetical protein